MMEGISGISISGRSWILPSYTSFPLGNLQAHSCFSSAAWGTKLWHGTEPCSHPAFLGSRAQHRCFTGCPFLPQACQQRISTSSRFLGRHWVLYLRILTCLEFFKTKTSRNKNKDYLVKVLRARVPKGSIKGVQKWGGPAFWIKSRSLEDCGYSFMSSDCY